MTPLFKGAIVQLGSVAREDNLVGVGAAPAAVPHLPRLRSGTLKPGSPRRSGIQPSKAAKPRGAARDGRWGLGLVLPDLPGDESSGCG